MRAIITGAASGIGKATALRLAHDAAAKGTSGSGLLLVDRDAEALASAAAECAKSGVSIATACVDLTDPAACSAIVEKAADTLGGLDAVVSNAAILKIVPLLDLSLEDYERMFAINTRATFLIAKAAFPLLKESKGSLVATASLAAHACAPYLGVYAASKAALVMLVRQLAHEWGPHGIRCNTISPGSTRTNIMGKEMAAQMNAQTIDKSPLGFTSEPSDQAAAIAFLLSADARYITGSDLVIDGGKQTMLLAAG